MPFDKVPTESELSILKILWDRGPSTVHEVQEALPDEPGYTTVLKFLQIMYDKGIVDRQKEGRAHRYWSLLEKESTQQKMLGDLADRLFDGSITKLMQQAVSSNNLDKEDLDELEKLLHQLKTQESSTNG